MANWPAICQRNWELSPPACGSWCLEGFPGRARDTHRSSTGTLFPPRTVLNRSTFDGTLNSLMKRISREEQMKTSTDQETHTSWFRRIFAKPTPTAGVAAEALTPETFKKPARNQTVLVGVGFAKIRRNQL